MSLTVPLVLNTYSVEVLLEDETTERFRIIAKTAVEAERIAEDLVRCCGDVKPVMASARCTGLAAGRAG